MLLAQNINEVIKSLETIIWEADQEHNPLGLFAALYQKVTIRVKEGIENGRFEDGARMERLDVIFANRYLEAYQQYDIGKPVTQSWETAFEVSGAKDLLVIQHLLLGMNAHINLDLGIAAAETMRGDDLNKIKNDFMEINVLLNDLLEEVQSDISSISPLFALLDRLTRKKDEYFAKFSMKAARDHAWLVAQRLVGLEGSQREEVIESTDKYVAGLAQLIIKPGKLVGFLIRIARYFESRDVSKNIRVLKTILPISS